MEFPKNRVHLQKWVKYRVPYHFLDEMREAIAPFMRLDKHGRGYEQVSIFDSCF